MTSIANTHKNHTEQKPSSQTVATISKENTPLQQKKMSNTNTPLQQKKTSNKNSNGFSEFIKHIYTGTQVFDKLPLCLLNSWINKYNLAYLSSKSVVDSIGYKQLEVGTLNEQQNGLYDSCTCKVGSLIHRENRNLTHTHTHIHTVWTKTSPMCVCRSSHPSILDCNWTARFSLRLSSGCGKREERSQVRREWHL